MFAPMLNAAGGRPRGRKTVRVIVEFIAFLILVVSTAVLLRPIQRDLHARMVVLRDQAIGRAEERIGRRIEYRSMGPSIFGTIDIRGVRLLSDDDAIVASAARIRVGYSLAQLFSKIPVDSIRSISIDRPVVNIDVERDADLIDLVMNRDVSASPVSLLPANVRVRVRGGSLLWTDGYSSVTFSSLSLSASSSLGRLQFDLKTNLQAKAETVRLPIANRLGVIRASFRVSGELSTDFHSGSVTVSMPSMISDTMQLRPITALLLFSDAGIEIRKIKDRSPFDLYSRYDAANGQWFADLKLENFSPRDVLSLRGAWASMDSWLGCRTSGSISANWGHGDASYRFDLSGSVARLLSLGATEVDLKGNGNENSVSIKRAKIRSTKGVFDFSGRFSFRTMQPEGTLSLENVLLGDGSLLSTKASVSSEGNATTLFADALSIGSMTFSAIDIWIRPEKDVFAFSASALRFLDLNEYEEVRIARVSSEGTFSITNPFLQFSLSLDSFSANDIFSVAHPFVRMPNDMDSLPAALGDAYVTTEIFVTSDFHSISFNAPRLVMAIGGGLDVFAVASLSGTNERLDLQDTRIIWKGGTASGSVSVTFADLADVPFSARLEYRDTVYTFEGTVLDGRTISLTGDYGLHANVLLSDNGGFSGFMSATSVPISISSYRLSTSIAATFRWESFASWSVDLEDLTVEVAGGEPARTLRAALRGSLNQDGAALRNLSVDDGGIPLAGNADLIWHDSLRSISGSLRLADDLGVERYEVDGALADGIYTAKVHLVKARLDRVFTFVHDAAVTGELRLRWKDLSDYDASWLISEGKAKFQGEDLSFSGAGVANHNTVDLEDAKGSYAGFSAEIPSLHVDWKDSSADTSFRLRGSVIGRDADLVARLKLAFTPFESVSSIGDALQNVSGTIDVSRARLDTLEVVEPFSFIFKKDSNQISLNGGPNDAVRFKTSMDGDFYLSFSAPAPLRGSILGSIADGKIEAGANGLYFDLQSIGSILPVPEVQFLGGLAIGSLEIHGPLGDPEITGTAQATGLRLAIPDWVIGETILEETTLRFEGNSFSFGPVAVTAGTGKATASGKFGLDRWIPSTFNIDIGIDKSTPIPFKVNVASVFVTGKSSGILRLSMENEIFALSGSLAAENTIVAVDTNKILSETSSAASPTPVAVKLRVQTGRKVEFAWPSSDIPVVRGYANAGDSIVIDYDGMSDRFSLVGDIALRGGEVFYFQRSFYIREGKIHFNENDVRFDPEIALRAELRDTYNSSQVIIALVVDESPLSSFTPRLESDPALSQVEIFALLGQNLVSADSESGSVSMQEAFLSASSDILAQFNVVRVFERTLRDTLNLDMFSIRTQLLQNAVLDATGLRSEPVDRNGGLGNYFDNTTVYMGKYITSDLFVQTMFSLRSDESKASNVFGGLTPEADLGLELKTPFFLIRWSSPLLHPENLFIDDQSFTLTWKWSF